MATVDDLPTEFFHSHNAKIGNNSGEMSNVQIQNVGYTARYLYYKGWTLPAICGLIGNARVESYLNPDIFENQAPYNITDLIKKGYGFAQFTPWLGTSTYNTAEKQRNYHGSNNPTYYRWCIDNGHSDDYWRLDLQLDYINDGLGASGWKRNVNTMRTINDIQRATEFFYYQYEKSAAGTVGTTRPANARIAYEYLYPYFKDSPEPPPVPPTPSTFPIWLLFKFNGRGL